MKLFSVLHFAKTAETIPRADRSRRKGSMQRILVAEPESRIQLRCEWHRVDRRIAKIWCQCVNVLLQQADSAWLYIEFIVCFGPSRISCLVKGWNCSLGDLNDRQSLRFHGWCGWQASCWESLLGQSSPHLPKRPRCKALQVVRCLFPVILWLHSLTKLWKAFGVNKNTVLFSWCFLHDLFLKLYLRAKEP